MSRMFDADEFTNLAAKLWSDRSDASAPMEPLYKEAHALINHAEDESEVSANAEYKIWTIFLDEFLVWAFCAQQTMQIFLFDALQPAQSEEADESDASDDRLASFARWALLTKIVSDLIATRILMTRGLEGQVRILSRSLIEHIDLLVAVCHDKELAAEFIRSSDPDKSNEFFYRHISKGKLKRRVRDILVNEVDDSFAYVVELIRKDADEIQSLYAHPSFLASFVSAFWGSEREYRDQGVLGGASLSSLISMSYVSGHLAMLNLSCPDIVPSEAIEFIATRGEEGERFAHKVIWGRSILVHMFGYILNSEMWVASESSVSVGEDAHRRTVWDQ